MQQSTELNDIILSLDELVESCGVERQWVIALIEENIITADLNGQDDMPQFSGLQLATVRRASRLSRDFDASVPAIGLILELLTELEQLRQFKRQWQTHNPTIEVQSGNEIK